MILVLLSLSIILPFLAILFYQWIVSEDSLYLKHAVIISISFLVLLTMVVLINPSF